MCFTDQFQLEDWGLKLFVAAVYVRRTENGQINWTHEETLQIKSSWFYSDIGHKHFNDKADEITGVMKQYVEQRYGVGKYDDWPSNKSEDYGKFVNHKLEMFVRFRDKFLSDELCEVWFQRAKSKLRTMMELLKKICGDSEKCLLVCGNSPIPAASPIKGYARPPIKETIKYLRQFHDVVIIDEFRTTKLCSWCYNGRYNSKKSRPICLLPKLCPSHQS